MHFSFTTSKSVDLISINERFLLDSLAYMGVVYNTLASALICEVADTPTGVVMNGYRVIRTELDSTA